MEKTVIFTAPFGFKGDKGEDMTMTEVYVAVEKGGLAGGLYTSLPVEIGDKVIISLKAKEGKARAHISEVWPKGKKPNI